MTEQTTPKPNGRPTLRTEAIVDDVLESLRKGITLAEVCKKEGYPSPTTFREWVRNDAQLSSDYAGAREDGFDAIALDMLNIANTPVEAFIDKMEFKTISGDDDGDPPKHELVVTERQIKDALGHRQLQVDTRKWLLARWDPKRYGERLAVDHGVQDSLADRMKAARERATEG